MIDCQRPIEKFEKNSRVSVTDEDSITSQNFRRGFALSVNGERYAVSRTDPSGSTGPKVATGGPRQKLRGMWALIEGGKDGPRSTAKRLEKFLARLATAVAVTAGDLARSIASSPGSSQEVEALRKAAMQFQTVAHLFHFGGPGNVATAMTARSLALTALIDDLSSRQRLTPAAPRPESGMRVMHSERGIPETQPEGKANMPEDLLAELLKGALVESWMTLPEEKQIGTFEEVLPIALESALCEAQDLDGDATRQDTVRMARATLVSYVGNCSPDDTQTILAVRAAVDVQLEILRGELLPLRRFRSEGRSNVYRAAQQIAVCENLLREGFDLPAQVENARGTDEMVDVRAVLSAAPLRLLLGEERNLVRAGLRSLVEYGGGEGGWSWRRAGAGYSSTSPDIEGVQVCVKRYAGFARHSGSAIHAAMSHLADAILARWMAANRWRSGSEGPEAQARIGMIFRVLEREYPPLHEFTVALKSARGLHRDIQQRERALVEFTKPSLRVQTEATTRADLAGHAMSNIDQLQRRLGAPFSASARPACVDAKPWARVNSGFDVP